MLTPDSNSSEAVPTAEPQTAYHAERPPGRGQTRIDSVSLMQGARELLIAHAGEEYRLRLTRNDKLILTK